MKKALILTCISIFVSLLFACTPAVTQELPQTEPEQADSEPESEPTQKSVSIPEEAILFASDRDGGEGIFTMEPDGSGIRKIEIQDLPKDAVLNGLAWSKATGIFVASATQGSDSDIFTFNWDGTGFFNITDSEYSWETSPVPSPDGQWISYISVATGQELMIMRMDGTDIRNLSNYAGRNLNNSWSPDSQRVYHNTNRAGTPNIFYVKPNGDDITNLTQGPGMDSTYSLSPDGDQMVFTSDRDGHLDIFTIPTTGGEAVNISQTDMIREMEPQWSPDGEFILYRLKADDQTPADLYLIKPDGSGQIQLTDTPEVDEMSHSWSPDSQFIIFSADVDGQSDIFILNVHDGSEPINITDTPTNEYGPLWIEGK